MLFLASTDGSKRCGCNKHTSPYGHETARRWKLE